jgi:DNA-binding LacI/PurR family transcriptional regulator
MLNTQATIRDIAIKLNISLSTVSRALRNAPDVNPQTKKDVLELAKKLNYEPNRVAQNLRIKRTNTLGVVVPQINLHFFSSAISGIQEYAAKHNYGVMICQSLETFALEKSNINMLVSNRVDGLLISLSSETASPEHLQVLVDKKIPVVLFDRVTDDLNVTKVIVNDRDGACKATDYLIETGCKRIAYIGGPSHLYISNMRLKGYEDALKKHNVAIDEHLIFHCDNLKHDVSAVVQSLLSLTQRPDAIFCLNDPIAVEVMQILKKEKVHIPDEISIIGFTNEPVSQFIEPSLTTVAQPAYEMGIVATELFIAQMENKNTYEPVTKMLTTELIIRNSTRKNKWNF